MGTAVEKDIGATKAITLQRKRRFISVTLRHDGTAYRKTITFLELDMDDQGTVVSSSTQKLVLEDADISDDDKKAIDIEVAKAVDSI